MHLWHNQEGIFPQMQRWRQDYKIPASIPSPLGYFPLFYNYESGTEQKKKKAAEGWIDDTQGECINSEFC